jgi:hypothetical protein
MGKFNKFLPRHQSLQNLNDYSKLKLILFTFVQEKWPKFVPNFIKTFNKTLQLKMYDFQDFKF